MRDVSGGIKCRFCQTPAHFAPLRFPAPQHSRNTPADNEDTARLKKNKKNTESGRTNWPFCKNRRTRNYFFLRPLLLTLSEAMKEDFRNCCQLAERRLFLQASWDCPGGTLLFH